MGPQSIQLGKEKTEKMRGRKTPREIMRKSVFVEEMQVSPDGLGQGSNLTRLTEL